MIPMTPRLAEALERLAEEADTGRIPLSLTEAVLAAYREAPQMEGKWCADHGAITGWWVQSPGEAISVPDQRTAELYRDYLNAADAALEGE